MEHPRPGSGGVVYTEDTRWRNRAEFPVGREEVRQFLQRKWARELDYRLIKSLWSFGGPRIAVRFAYEWHDDAGQWYRSYGNENWEFDADGLMHTRQQASTTSRSALISVSSDGRQEGDPTTTQGWKSSVSEPSRAGRHFGMYWTISPLVRCRYRMPW